jgi:hypothetical protein
MFMIARAKQLLIRLNVLQFPASRPLRRPARA